MNSQEKYLDNLEHKIKNMNDSLDRNINDMKNSLHSTEERIAQMIDQTFSEMRERDSQGYVEFIAVREDDSLIRKGSLGIIISAIAVILVIIIGIIIIAIS